MFVDLKLKFISNDNVLSVKMVKSVLIVHQKLLLEISWFSLQPTSLAVTSVLVFHQRMLWRAWSPQSYNLCGFCLCLEHFTILWCHGRENAYGCGRMHAGSLSNTGVFRNHSEKLLFAVSFLFGTCFSFWYYNTGTADVL